MACVGSLEFLTRDFKRATDLLQKAQGTEIVDVKEFLTELVSLAEDFTQNTSHLLDKANLTLTRYENIGTYDTSPASDCEAPDWDPGNRPSSLNDNQRQYLIKRGPCQPSLPRYPVSDDIPAGKQTQFSPKWYVTYPYLEYSISKDAAFCFVCSLFHGPTDEEAWSVTGVSAWHKMKGRGKKKPGKLVSHFTSEAHSDSLKAYAHFADPLSHVDTMLDASKRQLQIQQEGDALENARVVTILLDICRTLSRQDIAFRGDGPLEPNGNYNQFVMLMARHCPLLQKWLDNRNGRAHKVTYMSKDSQNEMIDLLGESVRGGVIKAVQAAQMYAVSADTTPDVSRHDQLAVVVRYVEQMIPHERLLGMKHVTAKTGVATAEEIVNCLRKHSLDTDNLVSQSYDFAKTMSGVYNGAQQKLQEIVCHCVPYIPCQCHRSNTVAEHGCETSAVIKEMFVVLEALYVFFSGSSKR